MHKILWNDEERCNILIKLYWIKNKLLFLIIVMHRFITFR